jgi:hypothetical protein
MLGIQKRTRERNDEIKRRSEAVIRTLQHLLSYRNVRIVEMKMVPYRSGTAISLASARALSANSKNVNPFVGTPWGTWGTPHVCISHYAPLLLAPHVYSASPSSYHLAWKDRMSGLILGLMAYKLADRLL